MANTENPRTTVSLDRSQHAALVKLAERHGWKVGDKPSAAKVIAVALDTLSVIMKAHEDYAAQHKADVKALYLRVAREAPSAFVQVPKDGAAAGRLGKEPAIQIGNWVVTDQDGDLLAEEMDGERRLGKLIDGEVHPLRRPAAMEAATFN